MADWTYYVLSYASGWFLKKDKSAFTERNISDNVYTCDDEASYNAIVAELKLKQDDVYWLRVPKKKEIKKESK